ncbi:MAG: GntR family transcriptional regulator/MocR family aminotransferase [Phenylobacterium sp.]|jgi:GntR family transcriptional regulator/MocR family aminotransferase
MLDQTLKPMKQLNLDISAKNGSQAMYLRLSRAIRKAIKSRQLQPDEQLPSARLLGEQLSLNRHTIMAAYHELIAEGWLESRQRKGYFVVSSLPVDSSQTVAIGNSSANTTEQVFNWRLIKGQGALPERRVGLCDYNFSGGGPDISLFPFKQFAGYVSDSLSRPNIPALNYGDNIGFGPFIEQIEIYLRRMRSLTGKKIVIVNGSQEALFLLAKVLLQPGDKVAVEKLGYQPAWAAFRDSAVELIGVNQDQHGIDPAHLEQLASAHQLRLIYLTPLHQYPTTVTLSVSRRLQIYQIAAKYKIPIVEDDYDHEFHYRCQPLAPMAADDPLGLVIYLSTFSKIMFPGIRLGFIAVEQTLADALVNYRSLTNHKPNVVMQDAIARWMADGAFERQLRKLTRTYEQRRNAMVALLQDYQRHGIKLDFVVPDGGMAMWIKTDFDAAELERKAMENSIFIQSENSFHLCQQDSENRYIRLGFAAMNETMMAEGLALLFSGLV